MFSAFTVLCISYISVVGRSVNRTNQRCPSISLINRCEMFCIEFSVQCIFDYFAIIFPKTIYLACIFSYLSSSANERWIQTEVGTQTCSLQSALTSLRVHNWKLNFFHDNAFFAGFAENIFSWKYNHKRQMNLLLIFLLSFFAIIVLCSHPIRMQSSLADLARNKMVANKLY